MKRKDLYLNTLIPGIIAISIYFLIRDDYYISFILEKCHLIDYYRSLFNITVNTNSLIGYFIKYSLGDLLWAWAFTFSSFYTFRNYKKTIIFSSFIFISFEIVQQLATIYVSGFDIMDIIAEMVGMFFCIIFIKIKYKY